MVWVFYRLYCVLRKRETALFAIACIAGIFSRKQCNAVAAITEESDKSRNIPPVSKGRYGRGRRDKN